MSKLTAEEGETLQNLQIDFYFILFYICPYLLLLPGKFVNKVFKKHEMKVRVVDYVTPVLILSIHIFSMLIEGISFIPYFVIWVSMIGIILTTMFAFKVKKLSVVKVLRVWWRYVFLSALLLYISLGVLMFI